MAVVADMPEAYASPARSDVSALLVSVWCGSAVGVVLFGAQLFKTYRALHPQQQRMPAQKRHELGCWCESTRTPCGSSSESQRPAKTRCHLTHSMERDTQAALTEAMPGDT